MSTDDPIDSIYARLRDDVAVAVSQILLQQSLRPQRFRSLNESLIAQIKASELFVLRHFNHLSPPLLPEAPRTEYCNDEPACPPFAPSIATAPGYPVYEGQPHVRSNPPTPPFSESDAQEQTVVGSRIRQSSNREASQSCEDAPFDNNRQGGGGPRTLNHPPEKLQVQERIQEHNASTGISENSPEALRDQEDKQSMASRTTRAQICPNGRLAAISTTDTKRRQSKVPPRPPYRIQTRSKIRPKLNCIAPSRTATLLPHPDNTSRDDESDASATTGKCVLTRGPEILGSLWDKAGRAGRVEMMREVVYDMIRTLRVGVMWERQQSALLQVPQRFSNFQALREELELSSVGEQLCRLRRRVAFAKFYNDYTNAQADPHGFLYPGQNNELLVKPLTANRKRKRAPTSCVKKRRGKRLSTLMYNRIVDLMFPRLVLSDENIEFEEVRMKREEKVKKRKIASQKIKNWRANRKP